MILPVFEVRAEGPIREDVDASLLMNLTNNPANDSSLDWTP
mgnify:FL=1